MRRFSRLWRACPRALVLALAVVVSSGATGVAAPSALADTGSCASQPPAAPTGLQAVNQTSDSVTLVWNPSTPGACPVADYWVYWVIGTNPPSPIGVAAQPTTNSATISITEPVHYYFWVQAYDTQGNGSAWSSEIDVDNTVPPSSPPPSSPPPGDSCHVTYTPNNWQGGFTANITITNTSSTTINGWALTFTFPGDQKITNAWNATDTQTGENVSLKNVSYNPIITPGGSQSLGFQGTWTASDTSPSSFALNGTPCT